MKLLCGLGVLANSFMSDFPKIGHLEMKRIRDKNKADFTSRTKTKARDLKDQLENRGSEQLATTPQQSVSTDAWNFCWNKQKTAANRFLRICQTNVKSTFDIDWTSLDLACNMHQSNAMHLMVMETQTARKSFKTVRWCKSTWLTDLEEARFLDNTKSQFRMTKCYIFIWMQWHSSVWQQTDLWWHARVENQVPKLSRVSLQFKWFKKRDTNSKTWPKDFDCLRKIGSAFRTGLVNWRNLWVQLKCSWNQSTTGVPGCIHRSMLQSHTIRHCQKTAWVDNHCKNKQEAATRQNLPATLPSFATDSHVTQKCPRATEQLQCNGWQNQLDAMSRNGEWKRHLDCQMNAHKCCTAADNQHLACKVGATLTWFTAPMEKDKCHLWHKCMMMQSMNLCEPSLFAPLSWEPWIATEFLRGHLGARPKGSEKKKLRAGAWILKRGACVQVPGKHASHALRNGNTTWLSAEHRNGPLAKIGVVWNLLKLVAVASIYLWC